MKDYVGRWCYNPNESRPVSCEEVSCGGGAFVASHKGPDKHTNQNRKKLTKNKTTNTQIKTEINKNYNLEVQDIVLLLINSNSINLGSLTKANKFNKF